MSFARNLLRMVLKPRARLEPLPVSISRVGAGTVEEVLLRRSRWFRLRQVLRNPPLMLGLVIVAGLFLVVLFGPLWATHDHYLTAHTVLQHYDSQEEKLIKPPFNPSAESPLGTDQWGNDLLSLVLTGARITLVISLYITFARVMLGLALGSLAGWKSGSLADRAVVGLAGIVSSVPMLLSAMILILAIGIHRGLWVFVISLAIIGWTEIAQMMRGEMMVIRQKTYIEGAEAVGLTNLQTIVRHALPNLIPQLLVVSALEMGAVLILLAELGFLGVYIGGSSMFSLDPAYGRSVRLMETPEWGALLAQGVPSWRSKTFLIFGPTLAFFVSIVGFNALGEGLRRLIERSGLNTALLLRKRVLLFAAALVAISVLVMEYTGPRYSFTRLARSFDSSRAASHAVELAGLENQPAAEYIRDRFEDYEVERGVRTATSSGFFWEVEAGEGRDPVPLVLGFIPGYDYDLGDELVVLIAAYDDQTQASTRPDARAAELGPGMLLEIARLWHENNVDPRRSVMFVAWGSSQIDPAAKQVFLEDPQLFRRLPIPSRETVHPAVVVTLQEAPEAGQSVWLGASSDQNLRRLFSESAGQVSGRMELDISQAAFTPSPDETIPSFELRWPVGGMEAPEDMKMAGQTLALSLTRILRQAMY